MGKDPAFLFYPNDWVGGTMGMTFEEKGAYFELLMLQFNRGHMTYDMIAQTVGRLWDKISLKFVQDENGLWFNERLEVEKNKRMSYTKSRNNNRLGVNQHTKKSKSDDAHMTTHMSSHMENENENIYINNKTNIDLENYKYKDCLEFLEKEFNTPISPTVFQKMCYEVDEFGVDVVKLAISEGSEKRSWKYVEAILNNWSGMNIKTVEQARKAINDFKNSKSSRGGVAGGVSGGNNGRPTEEQRKPEFGTVL